MTLHDLTHGKASVPANNRAGDAAPLHAYATNGEVFVKDGGTFWHFDPYKAWCEWLWCASSPIPSTQERAREIRAVLDSIGYTYGLH